MVSTDHEPDHITSLKRDPSICFGDDHSIAIVSVRLVFGGAIQYSNDEEVLQRQGRTCIYAWSHFQGPLKNRCGWFGCRVAGIGPHPSAVLEMSVQDFHNQFVDRPACGGSRFAQLLGDFG
jgi:hypothetical protein